MRLVPAAMAGQSTGDAWATRYVGRLSEQRVRFRGASSLRIARALVRHVLIGLTSRANSRPVPTAAVNNTATHHRAMTVLADTRRAFRRRIGTLTAVLHFFPLQRPPDAGLFQRECGNSRTSSNGFIHDTPDGKVRLELPSRPRGQDGIGGDLFRRRPDGSR